MTQQPVWPAVSHPLGAAFDGVRTSFTLYPGRLREWRCPMFAAAGSR